MMRLLSITALLLAACGATNKDGTCKDYKPPMSCPAGYDYVCQTTDQGCQQCSCVQNKDFPEAPGYD